LGVDRCRDSELQRRRWRWASEVFHSGGGILTFVVTSVAARKRGPMGQDKSSAILSVKLINVNPVFNLVRVVQRECVLEHPIRAGARTHPARTVWL
jgi:hypothetical protein